MQKMKKFLPYILFIGIVLILFYKTFAGYSIQGIDSGLWSTIFYKNNALKTPFFWHHLFWLGMSQGSFIYGIFWFMTQITPVGLTLFFTYSISIFLAMIFFFILLGKYKLSLPAKIFGSISYGLLPMFITLIYSGHIQVVEFLAYMPIVFLCIEEIYEPTNSPAKKIFYFGLIAIAWGFMVNLDIQRGLYFSIVTSIYVIYKAIQLDNKKGFFVLTSWPFYKRILMLVIIGLSAIAVFSNALPTWLEALKGRQALQEGGYQKSDEEKFDFASSWSLHPFELIDSIAFGFHGMISGDEKGPYWGEKPYSGNSDSLGFFIVFFALMGVIISYKRDKKVQFFFWAAVFLILLSFGRYWPGKPLFYIFYKIPLMSNFRAPAKFFSIAAFFISILASIGFDELIKKIEEQRKIFTKNLVNTLAALIGISLFFIFIMMLISSDLSINLSTKFGKNTILADIAVKNIFISLFRLLIYLVITAITIFMLSYKKTENSTKIYSIVFTAFCFFDLFTINNFYISKCYIKEKEFYKPDGVVSFLKNESKKELFRTATSVFIPYGQRSVQYPITRLKGYYLTYDFTYHMIETLDIPAASTVYPEYENFFLATLKSEVKGQDIKTILDVLELNKRLFELANVKYVLIDGIVDVSFLFLTNIVKARDGKDAYIYFNKNYLPRLSLYENFINVKDNRESLNYLSSPDFNFKNTAIISAKNISAESGNGTNNCIPIEIKEFNGWKYKAIVKSQKEAILVGSFKFEPENWKAKLDGKMVETFAVNYLLTGVFVPAGEHIVEIYYEQSKFFFYLSLIAIIAFTILSLIGGVLYIKGVKKSAKR
ncbi:MAG: hypothetical protein N2258_05485 [Brevinematales bacterium]|nr:hypothetical protein [Brevinematales bacterium]